MRLERDVARNVAELDARGFTVLEGLLDPAVVDGIRAEFLHMLDRVRARDRAKLRTFIIPKGALPGQIYTVPASPQAGQADDETANVQIPQDGQAGQVLDVPAGADREHGPIADGHGGLQETERYTMHLPWRAPFADPTIFENSTLLALLEQFWGTEDFRCTCMHSNCPFPGARYQRWHRDGGGEFEQTREQLASSQRNPALALVIPLCTTRPLNGALEIIPSSHTLPDYYGAEKQQNDALFNERLLVETGAHAATATTPVSEDTEGATSATVRMDARLVSLAQPVRVTVHKGSVWLRDTRCLHRGTPNLSTEPRPELLICYAKGGSGRNREGRDGGCHCDDHDGDHSPTIMGRPYDYYFQHGGISAQEYAALQLSERGEQLLGWARPGQGSYDAQTGVVPHIGKLGRFSRL